MSSANLNYGECIETYEGLYPGVVDKITDPDNKCRVKVLLPWIAPDFVSEWAPVAQLYAGGGYGSYWVPEDQDQVIVAFLNGELRRPIVLGSLYSQVRTPHATRTNNADPKYFRTKGGHMLLMEDNTGKRVELVDSSGNNSVLIDTEANSISIVADADVSIQAGGNLNLNADGDVNINASGSVNVSAPTINLN